MSKNRKKTGVNPEAPRKGLTPAARKAFESSATFGMLLVAVGLAVPFVNPASGIWLEVFKWIYASGAVIFTVARIVGVNHPGDSFRVKRLRRLECWAGIAFLVGAFFWFYNEHRFGVSFGLTLTVLRETIMFTLAGAMIQLITVWMIYYREKKDGVSHDS